MADLFAVFGMNKKRCCHKATGLVVACVAGGHILLATAGIAGLSFNAAQYMMDCGFFSSQTVQVIQLSSCRHAHDWLSQEPGAGCNHDSDLVSIQG